VNDEGGTGPVIERLIGVYNAEGSLRGELSYWVGARLGRAHCALCDITHGLVRERSDWRDCRDGLPVPFETHHLDDQPAEVRSLLDGRAPAVVADTGAGLELLLDGDAIDRCHGSPDELASALLRAASESGFRWAEE